jgi:hypothetical protein
MWKRVYIDYQIIYPNSYHVEKTIKDHLRDTLKELKIETSNQEGSKKATLQCDQVLKHLKATNGHAIGNVLQRCQSLIDGAFIPIFETPCSN